MTEPREQEASSMRLGRADLRVSRLGIGAMVWGDMSTAPRWNPARNAYGPTSSAEEQRRALEVSLAAGVSFVDTAAMYGKGASERRVGELTAGKDVVVATKFPFSFLSRSSSLPVTLGGSLARPQRTTIDLYQVHYPFRWMSIPTLMKLMTEAAQAGKIRAVGVSNCNAQQMRSAHAELARRGIRSRPTRWSTPCRTATPRPTACACRELGVTLIAYMPLASGALTGKYSATARPTGWRRYTGDFRGSNLAALARLVEVLREIGARRDRSPGQVALRWLIQQDGVLPIPGAKNASQATQNAGALTFTLDDAEVDALSQATKAARP